MSLVLFIAALTFGGFVTTIIRITNRSWAFALSARLCRLADWIGGTDGEYLGELMAISDGVDGLPTSMQDTDDRGLGFAFGALLASVRNPAFPDFVVSPAATSARVRIARGMLIMADTKGMARLGTTALVVLPATACTVLAYAVDLPNAGRQQAMAEAALSGWICVGLMLGYQLHQSVRRRKGQVDGLVLWLERWIESKGESLRLE